MFFFDMRYLMFMLPAMILMAGVQWYVSSAYKKWNQKPVRSGLTGAQAAQRLISRGGLYDVKIEGIRGNLTDHYDPRNKVLALSQGVHQNSSVASLAITAHELGHAMQDKEGYAPLRLRAALIPAVNIGSYLGWILIFLGMLLRFTELAWLGIIVFSGGALFALATIPVELNASARAKRLLTETGLVMGEEEQQGVNKVLNAAALTYVAALATAVLQLLYFASMVIGMGGRRR
jgi:Zn-dependent membrane protease YugP